jgi:hypothetical protein
LLPPEATFAPPTGNAPPDPFLQLWAQGKGLYCSTGALIALLRRKIPGHFIVSAVYMISEKACDVILEDAERVATPCAEPAPALTQGSAAEPERVIAV